MFGHRNSGRFSVPLGSGDPSRSMLRHFSSVWSSVSTGVSNRRVTISTSSSTWPDDYPLTSLYRPSSIVWSTTASQRNPAMTELLVIILSITIIAGFISLNWDYLHGWYEDWRNR
jgi:hypothetical protein